MVIWADLLKCFILLSTISYTFSICEFSVSDRNKLYNFSLASPLPKYPHGVLSEDGFYKVAVNGTVIWFQLCDGMVFNHDLPRCLDCRDCGGPSHCGMECSALVAHTVGGYPLCTTIGHALSTKINIIDEKMPHKGVIVKMSSRKDSCSLTVSVICDVNGVQGPQLLNKTGICDYATVLRHPSGCAEIVDIHGRGWGWFSFFLLISACLFGAYLLVGTVYRYFQGIRGIDIIPNLEFWSSIPQRTQSLFASLVRKFRGPSQGSRERGWFETMKPPLSSSSSSSSVLRKPRHLSPYLFSLLAFIVFVAILYGEDVACVFNQQLQLGSDSPRYFTGPSSLVFGVEKKREKALPFAIGKTDPSCDIFSGRWVYDESRPLYEESDCPYIQPQLTCLEHGRPETNYQHWRWQPNGCDLPSYEPTICECKVTEGPLWDGPTICGLDPRVSNECRVFEMPVPLEITKQFNVVVTNPKRFNATLMLETLRGKRMMFVGDSLNRGQYVSMVCLLHKLIPEDGKSMETFDSLTVFTAKEYNATIEFYWAPFILESNSDNAVIHRVSDRIVRKGSINKHGKHWKGVDIMVFNTYLWWMTGLKMKILRGSFDDEAKDIMELSTEDAYRMAMRSMLRWVRINMDRKKTRVFFTSMSPTHAKSGDWGGVPGRNCYNETRMIEDPNYWGSDSRKSIMEVIGDVFRKSKFPVTFLNITQLSLYRKDAHTSIYKKQWSPLTPEQIANPVSYADCTHWCLPGLQDTWNELLFAKLFYP
ncbi:hypothetical protein F8388_011843 [Cannabis sativa]|uniref:Trichome birefringence-like N-terminal domain-containing protein n=1 Tax=Cannabis sativa TaxID=3483 RepID=A0A7J6DWF1_CANSA|nr:hypothetical protein G4B88_025823 [Cannabis sativa]KAF4364051.1 hypothetical protein F8388_011843 [Cannabis sativa]